MNRTWGGVVPTVLLLAAATLPVATSCGAHPAPPLAPQVDAGSVAAEPPPAPEPPPPAPDLDGDTLVWADDLCPDAAEDADSFEDGDGCPEPDNDEDRIADGEDRCPNEPETYNGRDDEDGCPDNLLVLITRDPPPRGAERVHFDANRASIRATERELLQMVAAVLEQNPQLERLLVEGHAASDEGSERARNRLSLRRAEAVVEFLVDAGIAAERLRAAGYGDRCPFDPGESEQARDGNRVVTFTILRSDGACTGVGPGCPAAVEAGLVPTEDCAAEPAE
jgi:outer membrane protein OmpA-like peptidoglycan-associated protein